VIFVGGCHTIGVLGAAKAFSAADIADDDKSDTVLSNASIIRSRKLSGKPFAIWFDVKQETAVAGTPEFDPTRLY